MKSASSALLGLLLVASAAAGAGEKGVVLWYAEQEAGIEPYKVRYIVSRDFLRSDEGSDEGEFVLLDRAERQIYSVVTQNRTILHIDGRGQLAQVPPGLAIEIKRSADEKAPKVGGAAPVTLELVARKELCYSAVVVPGHLEQARLIPFDGIQAGVAGMQLAKDTPIFLYCAVGGRAEKARQSLLAQGYTNVVNVGGLDDARALLAR